MSRFVIAVAVITLIKFYFMKKIRHVAYQTRNIFQSLTGSCRRTAKLHNRNSDSNSRFAISINREAYLEILLVHSQLLSCLAHSPVVLFLIYLLKGFGRIAKHVSYLSYVPLYMT